jgi:hypothetical protein
MKTTLVREIHKLENDTHLHVLSHIYGKGCSVQRYPLGLAHIPPRGDVVVMDQDGYFKWAPVIECSDALHRFDSVERAVSVIEALEYKEHHSNAKSL